MKKAIIFDMDGTLVNSIPWYFQVHKRTFQESIGYTLTKEYFYTYCNGQSAVEFYSKILNQKGLPHALITTMQKVDHKFAKEHHMLKIFPHVKTLLKKLSSLGVKLALATSSPRKYANKVLTKNDIKKYFDVIVTRDNVEKSKPHPDIFLQARRQLHVQKKNCVVVEDSINGFKAAKRANIDCIGVMTSLTKKQIPFYVQAVKNHKELSTFLLK